MKIRAMTVTQKGNYWYGSCDSDICAEVTRFSRKNAYEAQRFQQSVCGCGSVVFRLLSDDAEGVAKRLCVECAAEAFIGDGVEYADDAVLEEHGCVCQDDRFAINCGVALYEGSNDVRWLYIGCRCRTCGLIGVFAHWKCEGGDADVYLSRV